MLERFFRDITQDCIREGSFGSIQELVNAITNYLACGSFLNFARASL